jgi:hypothetical protein
MRLQLDYAHDFTTKIEKVLDREIKKTVSESMNPVRQYT